MSERQRANHRHAYGPIRRRLALLLGALVLLSGCSGIPTHSQVNDVTKVAAADPGEAVAPSAGQPPDDIVRGFLGASGRGATDTSKQGAFSNARQYLTADAQKSWPASSYRVLILAGDDRVIWSKSKEGEATVVGTIFGTLDDDGTFHEGGGQYKHILKLTKVAGEWRIANPPSEVVIREDAFLQTYRQISIYFLDQATGSVVVPDQRYISVPNDKRIAKLMDLLLGGPGGWLKGAVRTQLDTAELRSNVIKDDAGVTTVDLTGVTFPTAASRRALAAQIVWTLSKDADQITIKVGGKLLETATQEYTLSNFQSFNPDRTPGTGIVLSDPFYISGSSGPPFVVRSLVDGTRMPGPLGDGSLNVVSAAMSAATGTVAAVTSAGAGGAFTQQLVIGSPGRAALKPALKAASLTQPSFSRSGDEVWVVQNGASKPEVYQISASTVAGEQSSRAKIGSTALLGKGAVTALQISPDGVRVAIVAGGKLYLGAVSSPVPIGGGESPPGSEVKAGAAITNLTQLGTDLTNVSAVVFNSSTELLVAANSGGTLRLISRIAIDGSYTRSVSSDGINGDVDSLTVSNSGPATLFAAFNNRVYRLDGIGEHGLWSIPTLPNSSGLLYGSNPFFPE